MIIDADRVSLKFGYYLLLSACLPLPASEIYSNLPFKDLFLSETSWCGRNLTWRTTISSSCKYRNTGSAPMSNVSDEAAMRVGHI